LLVKTSSLGDVIHCLPAVSDIVRNTPHVKLHWLVEAPFAEICALHPGVSRVIPMRLRQWRKAPFAEGTRTEVTAFVKEIRRARYDRVIDAQGLIRTAALAHLARGPICGYDAVSVREPPAAMLYARRYPVSVTIHAVERMRSLAAQSLGYALPDELDYGVDVEPGERPWPAADRYIVGLHATARPDKRWPEAAWVELAQRAAAQGLAVVLPWGDDGERARSERIAAAAANAVTPPKLGFGEMARLLAGAAAVVGVDTGLTHLASAVGAPVVAIYAASWSEFNGVVGPAFVANLGGPGAAPSVDEVWESTQRALSSGRRTGPWRAPPAPTEAAIAGRRRFRPSNSRAVVHRS
jgi:heptosyltransferase-1